MDGKTAVELAADLAAGTITQHYIREKYGSGMLTTVLGLGAAVGVGFATNAALEFLDKETGIVSDVGGVVEDVVSEIFDLF